MGCIRNACRLVTALFLPRQSSLTKHNELFWKQDKWIYIASKDSSHWSHFLMGKLWWYLSHLHMQPMTLIALYAATTTVLLYIHMCVCVCDSVCVDGHYSNFVNIRKYKLMFSCVLMWSSHSVVLQFNGCWWCYLTGVLSLTFQHQIKQMNAHSPWLCVRVTT